MKKKTEFDYPTKIRTSPASSATIRKSDAVVNPVTLPETYFEPKCDPLMLYE